MDPQMHPLASRGRGRLPRVVVALVVASLVVACGGTAPSSAGGRIVVVTTSTVFADLVANVGGDLVAASSIVPKNTDVHTFDPRPADVRAVAGARLLVMNGLGFDDWLEKTITNAAAGGTPLVRLGEDQPDLIVPAGGSESNPHLWLDVAYAKRYVERIRDGLVGVDAAHRAAYEANAAAYEALLDALDAKVRAAVGGIPETARRIVTFHDAFPYFARAYGIEIVGVAVQAPGQDPSAGETAALIDAIRTAGVKAIFSERQFPARLVDAIASETGATVVSNLYSDSLGDDPVTSYAALMDWDTARLVEALR